MKRRRQSDEEIAALTDEELVNEFAAEVDGNTRSISTDPDDEPALRAELLKRLNRRERE